MARRTHDWRLNGTRAEVGRDERPTVRSPYVPVSLDWLKSVRRSASQEDSPLTHVDRFFGTLVDDGGDFLAPSRLRFPSRFTHERTLSLHDLADWSRTPPDLAYFAASTIEIARKAKVPLYVSSAGPDYVGLAHAVYSHQLTPHEWGLLRAWGFRAIARKNLSVRPASSAEPGVWLWNGDPLPGTYGPVMPLRMTPRGILAVMKGR